MAKLIYGNGPNSFYAMGIEISDPYLWVQDDQGRTHTVLNDLEIGHAQREAHVDDVHPLRKYIEAVKSSGNSMTESALICAFLKEQNITSVDVPADFPAALMVSLSAENIDVKPVKGSFFEGRTLKTEEEIEKIRLAQSINEQAFLCAFEIFQAAIINKDLTLSYKGELLTSEYIQGQMNARAAELGATSFNGGPIVAGGALSADPHERGKGLLKANEFIIIDSFPRVSNGYNGDLTRTIIKGEISEFQQSLYDSVKRSQQLALDMISPEVTGADVHKAVAESMKNDGFETGVDVEGRAYGFFHGTGHALGVEVHDDGPGLSPRNTDKLKENMVVTVEPGLYYPEKGGARIEDIVAVTQTGINNLTTLPKILNVDEL